MGVAFDVNTTAQTLTGSSGWLTSNNSSLASSQLTAGVEYLLIVCAQYGGGSTSSHTGMRVVHGSTVFSGSEEQSEIAFASSEVKNSYLWWTKWTAVASEDITLEVYQGDSAANVYVDMQSIIAIPLTGIANEHDINTTQTASTTTYADGASITFTPASAGNYLVLGRVTFNPSGDFDYCYANLNNSLPNTDDPANIECIRRADEVVADESARVMSILKVVSLGTSEVTLKMQHREGTDEPEHHESEIIAIRTDAFPEFQHDYAPLLDAGTDVYDLELGSVSITPASESDVVFLAFFINDANNSGNSVAYRTQVGGSDNPAGQTTADYDIQRAFGIDDELPCWQVGVIDDTTAASTIDLDQGDATSATQDMLNATLVAFTIANAAGGTTSATTSASTSASSSLTSTASTSLTTSASSSLTTSASSSLTSSLTSSASSSLTSSISFSFSTSGSTSGSTSATSSGSLSSVSTSATSSASLSSISTSASSSLTNTTISVPVFEDVPLDHAMLTLNHAGNSSRNPIVSGIKFRITLNKHNQYETLKAVWVTDVNGQTLSVLTENCVETDYTVTCDVTAGVELVGGDPPVLNVIHMTTEYAPPELDPETSEEVPTVARPKDSHVTGAVFVASVPPRMITLDGFSAEVGTPAVFRPSS